MFSFRKLLSAASPSRDQQSREDKRSHIEISDDSNEENNIYMNNGGSYSDQDSGSEKKKRKRDKGIFAALILFLFLNSKQICLMLT